MPRPRSAASDSDDEGGVAEKEAEYARLQREYRTMQGDRQAYTEQTQAKIRKQRSQIANLEDEKAELSALLNLAESDQNQVKDEHNVRNLEGLAQRKQDLEQEIENERKRHQELDSKIHEWERKVRKQQKSMGGINMGREFSIRTNRKVRVLEGRLDKALQRFNHMLTENGDLRQNIDNLRIERLRFEEVYSKMNRELQNTRREIGEVIEQSKIAYEQREEAQAKMVVLREKSEKDQQQFNAEKKELIRILDHDRKLREFMNIKSKEREEDPQLAAWKQKQAAEAEQKRAQAEENVQTYEQAFERIKEITQEPDLDLLVDRFIEVEDTNFALFNYVSEQHNRIELLQEEIQNLKADMERFRSQSEHIEEERQTLMKQLEEKQMRISSEADEYQQTINAINKILDQLKTGIDSLFTKMGCDRTPLDEMLASGSGVTDDNIVQYLGIIEQKTNELLTVQAFVNSKDYDNYDKNLQSVLGDGPPQASTLSSQQTGIVPPALGDEFETDDEEDDGDGNQQRPLSRSALEQKVIKIVKRREFVQSEREKQRYGTDMTLTKK